MIILTGVPVFHLQSETTLKLDPSLMHLENCDHIHILTRNMIIYSALIFYRKSLAMPYLSFLIDKQSSYAFDHQRFKCLLAFEL
jgi:hypothetical protein